MEQETIERIKNQISTFLKEGGKLYGVKVKDLPFYESVRYIRRHSDVELRDFAEAMRFLGFDYDPEFGRYSILLETLKTASDELRFVDALKKHRNGENPEFLHADTILKESAKKLHCTPSDYLLLMTPYRYRTAQKKTDDFASEIIKIIKSHYPDGDVSRFKREDPKLYNSIRTFLLQSQCDEITMAQLANLLDIHVNNFNNADFSDKKIFQHLNEEEIVQEYINLPKAKRFKIAQEIPDLYRKIYICSVKSNVSVYEWFVKHGITPPTKTRKQEQRLGRVFVDPAEREHEIREKQKEIIKKENLVIPENEIEKYYFMKELTKKVLNELSSEEALSDEPNNE